MEVNPKGGLKNKGRIGKWKLAQQDTALEENGSKWKLGTEKIRNKGNIDGRNGKMLV